LVIYEQLFVFVGVISWIVLHLSAEQVIHEITRTNTKKILLEEQMRSLE